MNFKPIPNKFEYLNWQEIESIAKDKRSTVIWPFGAVEQTWAAFASCYR